MDPKGERDEPLREEDVRVGDRLDDSVSEDDGSWPAPVPGRDGADVEPWDGE